jgi:hypothetical protein
MHARFLEEVVMTRSRDLSRWAAIALAGCAVVAGLAAVRTFWTRHLGAPRPRVRGTTRPPITQPTVPANPADADLGEPGRNTEQRLDEALMETFPTSDPIATRIE